jgi:hypothetical protein
MEHLWYLPPRGSQAPRYRWALGLQHGAWDAEKWAGPLAKDPIFQTAEEAV